MSRRLRSQILACTRCELGEFSNSQEWHHVPWVGGSQSGVAVIGEAPGKDEALSGEPFVGRAGTVLNQGLTAARLTRDDVWIMNVICCRPKGNDFDSAISVGAVEACRPWFNEQLDASKAWLVVLVGKRAYQAVFDDDIPLTRVRGKGQWMDGRLWVPTWHPAYVLRQGGAGGVADEFFEDWRKVGMVASGVVGPTPPAPMTEAMGEQLEIHFPGEKIRDTIKRKGWVRIYSHVLEDNMIVVEERKGVKIPEALRGEPRWTTDELVKVGWGGKLRMSVEDMRRVNLAKRVLGAEVVIG